MKVAEKTFVVTGGGNGIGREVVLNLLSKGSRVAALDLSHEGLTETASLAKSEKLSTHQVNISDLSQVVSSKSAVNAFHGMVNGVINVAGIIQPLFESTTLLLNRSRR
jgi:NAD(P)-dependent dehydrogenase (short-subunit alcohol dehydrogenase family)